MDGDAGGLEGTLGFAEGGAGGEDVVADDDMGARDVSGKASYAVGGGCHGAGEVGGPSGGVEAGLIDHTGPLPQQTGDAQVAGATEGAGCDPGDRVRRVVAALTDGGGS